MQKTFNKRQKEGTNMEFTVKIPMFGFEHVEKMTYSKIDDVFATLTATNSEQLPSFTLVNPYALRTYELEVPQATQIILDMKEEPNLLIYNIVIIHNPIEESTVNFLAPIILNTDNNTMAQLILDSSKYRNYGINESINSFRQ